MIHTGDCIEVMAGMPADSVDAIVTDPPAGISFMSKNWDHDKGGRTEWVAWMTEVMRECYRVLKPGGYAVVWSLPRTCHWTGWAMEDAGFYITDQLAHIFASGFPKGRTQLKPAREDWWLARKPGPLRPLGIEATRISSDVDYGRPTAQDGSGSNGAGSKGGNGLWHADDPLAHNPSKVLRAWSAAQPEADSAPLANALADAFVGRGVLDSLGGYPSCPHCGGGLARIAIASDRDDAPLRPDVPGAPPVREWSASRIRENQCADHLSTWDELARVVEVGDTLAYGNDTTVDVQRGGPSVIAYGDGLNTPTFAPPNPAGRWPSNLLLSDPALFDEPNPEVVGSGASVTVPSKPGNVAASSGHIYGAGKGLNAGWQLGDSFYGDSGGYSRFFLIPKSSRSDREPVVRGTLEATALRTMGDGAGEWSQHGPDNANLRRENSHPTVKPTDLMRHLVRLVTPTGGTVLDPFLGSGSTAIAAELEGFPWIGIEKEPEYVAIAEARLNGTQRGLGLDVGAPTRSRPMGGPFKEDRERKGYTTGKEWIGRTSFFRSTPDEKPVA